MKVEDEMTVAVRLYGPIPSSFIGDFLDGIA
jgi:hypothetical protein